MNEKNEIKSLWKACFDDDDDFVELYFKERYTPQRNMSAHYDGRVVAALQMLPYKMAFKNVVIPMWYISGACTHPDYRNRGIMYSLLKSVHTHMYKEGVDVSFLIPASDRLFDYYSNSGYSTLFYSYPYSECMKNFTLVSGVRIIQQDDMDDSTYSYYNDRMRSISCTVQHDRKDIHTVMADIRLSGGKLLVAYCEEVICGLAIIVMVDGVIIVKEILADSKDIDKTLLKTASDIYNTNMFKYNNLEYGIRKPYGMARIINMEHMLSIYASDNINEIFLIRIYGDDAIEQNNGYFKIKDGQCVRLYECDESRQNLPDKVYAYHIKDVIPLIFKGENPYMSLMMD